MMLSIPISITIGMAMLIIFSQLNVIETKSATHNYQSLTNHQKIIYQSVIYGVISLAVVVNLINWWYVATYFHHAIITWSIGVPAVMLVILIALFGQKFFDHWTTLQADRHQIHKEE